MTDTENDIRDDEFRVITHSDFNKHSSRTYLKNNWWVFIALAVVILIALGLIIL